MNEDNLPLWSCRSKSRVSFEFKTEMIEAKKLKKKTLSYKYMHTCN